MREKTEKGTLLPLICSAFSAFITLMECSSCIIWVLGKFATYHTTRNLFIMLISKD